MNAPEHPALRSPAKFCDLMAYARTSKFPGWWDGSAYRHHPVGIIRDGLIFTNEWNVNNYCSIRAMVNPGEEIPDWCHNPQAYGNPTPQPPSGAECVWGEGRWRADGPWRAKASAILYELEAHVEAFNERVKRERAEKESADKAAREAKLEALKAAHAGGAS